MISAEVIKDSISPQGKRLTTFKLRYPKFIHGEFMTHRVISRNASSSRAVPTAKLLQEVRSDVLRAAPVFWGKNQAGMQAAEELDGVCPSRASGWLVSKKQAAQAAWEEAALFAATMSEYMLDIGVHKQIANRILEPFSHINVVATATEWDNFFGLRLHKDAQPEMRALALAMWEARQSSEPTRLKPDDWHLPFIGAEEDAWVKQTFNTKVKDDFDIDTIIKVSVARCARVSYENFETGKRSTIEEDLKLYDRLLSAQPLHASPAEHQATPDVWWAGSALKARGWMKSSEHGNFVGWRQYRKMLPGESCAPLPEGYDGGRA